MAKFEDYKDEVKDFSLLVNNQFIIALIMNDVPILSYKLEVFTDVLLAKGLASLTTINIRVNDDRLFALDIKIVESDSEDFKLILILTYPKEVIVPKGTLSDEDMKQFGLSMSKPAIFEITPSDPAPEIEFAKEVKTFYFRPTISQGEAIVNESFIWLKEQIMLKVSGVN